MEPQESLPTTDNKLSDNGSVDKRDVPIVTINHDPRQDHAPATTDNIIGTGYSSAELFFQNDLIMSEVYKQIGIIKKDLINCLLISKANFGRVAMELYRDMKEDVMSGRHRLGYDSDRLKVINESVKTLQITLKLDDDTEPDCSDFAIKFSTKYPNLSVLELSNSTPHRTSLCIQGQTTVSGLTIRINKLEALVDSGYGFQTPPLKVSGAATPVTSCIIIYHQDNGTFRELSNSYADWLILDFIHCVKVEGSRDPSQNSKFAHLQVFIYEHREELEAEDLADFLSLCPNLSVLSVKVRSGSDSTKKLEEVFSSQSSKLNDVTLTGADLRWLACLAHCDSLSLTIGPLPSNDWLRASSLSQLNKEFDSPPVIKRGCLRLTFDSYWEDDDDMSYRDNFPLYHYIKIHSSAFAKVVVDLDRTIYPSVEWLRTIRSSLAYQKEEKELYRRMRHEQKKGFYLMQSPVTGPADQAQ